TNDAFPTAMHIAAATEIVSLVAALGSLKKTFEKKEREFKGIVKIGRTHLQDATPLTLSQELSGYVSLLKRDIHRIEQSLEGFYDLAICGTAVGTCSNAPRHFGEKVPAAVGKWTGLPFRSHPNNFAALSAHDEV